MAMRPPNVSIKPIPIMTIPKRVTINDSQILGRSFFNMRFAGTSHKLYDTKNKPVAINISTPCKDQHEVRSEVAKGYSLNAKA